MSFATYIFLTVKIPPFEETKLLDLSPSKKDSLLEGNLPISWLLILRRIQRISVYVASKADAVAAIFRSSANPAARCTLAALSGSAAIVSFAYPQMCIWIAKLSTLTLVLAAIFLRSRVVGVVLRIVLGCWRRCRDATR